MTVVNVPVPNLINGVSQQPKALRFDSQVEEMHNCYPSVTQGLMRRPGLEYVAETDVNIFGFAQHSHFINRDDTEQYIVSVGAGGSLDVFDLHTGARLYTDESVAQLGGPLYLSFEEVNGYEHNLPLYEFVTIHDYTFIWCRAKKVALTVDQIAPANGHGFIWIRTARPDTKYVVDLSLYDDAGAHVSDVSAEYTAGSTPATFSDHGYIADGLASAIQALLPTDWYAEAHGGTVHVYYNFPGTWSVAVSVENQDYMSGFSSITPVDSIQELPSNHVPDAPVMIQGTGGDTSYWVTFKTSNNKSSYTSGHWEEAPAPGSQYKLDPNTMPVAIRRNADGTWETVIPDWGQLRTGRATGGGLLDLDGISHEPPDFVGRRIISIFQRKGRLGFLAEGGAIVMSEVGNIFNFWRTTLQALLDSDPISIIASHNRPVSWVGYAEFDQQFIMVATNSQFILSEGDVLSPKSVSADKISEYDTEGHTPPIVVGKNMILPFKRGEYVGVRELALDRLSGRVDAVETTRHVPRYIEGDVKAMAGSSSENMIILFCGPRVNRTHNGQWDCYPYYVYNYYDGPGENGELSRLQSAWHEWQFYNLFGVAFTFIGSTLWFFNGEEIFKADFGGYHNHPGTNWVHDPIPHAPLLDRRVTIHQETNGVTPYREYDPVADETTVYMPWNISLETERWVPTLFQGDWDLTYYGPDPNKTLYAFHRGTEAEVTYWPGTGDHFRVKGDWYQDGYLRVDLGLKYTSRTRLTTPPNSRRSQRGSKVPSASVDGHIAYFHVAFENTTAFDVTVQYGDFYLKPQVHYSMYDDPVIGPALLGFHTAPQSIRTVSFRYYDTLQGPDHPNYFEVSDPAAILAPLTTDGEFTMDVSGDPAQCRVSISSNHVLGFQIVAAEWEKLAHARGRQGG